MEQKYLIDTNVIIDFAAGKLPQKGHLFMANIIDTQPCISFVNKIELLGFSNVSLPIIAFTKAAETIGITDAIIAATALVHKIELITRNEADFKKIDHLNVVNPHSL